LVRPENSFYRNITISGIAGTGSTTLLNALRTEFAPDGWTGFSGGEYMRQFLPDILKAQHGHHSAGDYDKSVDRQVDTNIRDRLQVESGLIIESWLSGFMAQGLPHVLKILLICTNELDRADRLASRDDMSSADAMLHAFERLKTNTERWSTMYAEEWQTWVVDTGLLRPDDSTFFWHPNLYDLIIDTGVHDPASCVEIVQDKLTEAVPA